MKDRRTHILTVQTGYAFRKRHDVFAGDIQIPVPVLTLKGKWLDEMGLSPSTKVEVIEQDDGSLVIRPATEQDTANRIS